MPEPWENQRFVGFLDLLGYGAIVSSPVYAEEQRFRFFVSVFEAIAVAVETAIADLAPNGIVRCVQFSDCFYFSSDSAALIVAVMAETFANAFTIQDLVYDVPLPGQPASVTKEWLPFLRGGIVRGWMFEGRDISIPRPVNPRNVFRNPIGPAVAGAYKMGEWTDVDGMCLMTSPEVSRCFKDELIGLQAATPLKTIASRLTPHELKTHPKVGLIHEIPWFECRLLTDNTVGTFDTLILAERQFDSTDLRHFRGTWDMILRSPGVQALPRLLEIARHHQFRAVQRLAGEIWKRRQGPLWDDWQDWFKAEGR